MEIVFDHSLAPHILPTAHISQRMLKRVVEIMCEFYPDSWLDELKVKYEKDSHLMFKHPIYSGLLKGVSVDAITVTELASCLHHLRGKTNIKKIIEEMKREDSFEDYFYQLTTSHRLNCIDANMELEPLIEGKTPDASFLFDGAPCIAECTIIKDNVVYDHFHECMEYLAKVTFNKMQKSNIKKNLKIEVKHESINRKRDEIELVIAKIIEENKNKSVDLDCCAIYLSDLSDIPEHDAGMTETILTREEYGDYYNSMLNDEIGGPGERASMRFLFSYKVIMDSIQKDFLEKLDNKIQSKRAQVKILKEKGYEIFLFVDTDMSWRKMEHDKAAQVMKENLLGSEIGSDLFSMITLTNKPRGCLDPFSINRITINRTSLSEEWWDEFWYRYMQPSVAHKFVVKAGRNDPCPCGIGLKYKHCHGSFSTQLSS